MAKAGSAYDAREARRLDLNSADLGVPVERLMTNAGRALAREVARHAKAGQVILVLCGKGNNGGDGFAAAAELQALGRKVLVVLAEPPARIATAAAQTHFARLAEGTWTVWRGRPAAAWASAPVILDCLLGSGLAGTPRAPYARLIAWTNARRRSGCAVISCDVPSGLGTKVAVRPTRTVALHAAQAGLAQANEGRVVVRPIGIPSAARHIGFGDAVLGYPGPRSDSHKGDNGAVLVVAGSLPLAGAPHYVAMGAYRAGADLVHVATPAEAATAVRAWGPDAIVHSVDRGSHLTPDAVPAISRLMRRCSALVIGPGLGTHPSTLAAARLLLGAAADLDLPVVVDADGLDALDAALLARHGHRMVLTPHGREFQDLAGRPATRANVSAYARANGVTVLRKGAIDVVSAGGTTRECHRGHPTMTVGGTGDVLAGIVGCLLAKGAAPFAAACAASFISKAAGEVAASLRSYGATAVDVADAVPAVLVRIEAAQSRPG